MTYSALVVSNNILRRAFDAGVDVTPMKLQKLLYFAACEYAKLTGEPLVANRFEAWDYGAVVRVVFDKFNPYGGRAISVYAKDAKGEARCVSEYSDPDIARAIDSVWRLGQHMTAVELARLTQRPGSGWYKARQNDSYIEFEDMVSDTTYYDRLGIGALV